MSRPGDKVTFQEAWSRWCQDRSQDPRHFEVAAMEATFDLLLEGPQAPGGFAAAKSTRATVDLARATDLIDSLALQAEFNTLLRREPGQITPSITPAHSPAVSRQGSTGNASEKPIKLQDIEPGLERPQAENEGQVKSPTATTANATPSSSASSSSAAGSKAPATDAVAYLSRVRARFPPETSEYQSFLHVLKSFKAHRMTNADASRQVTKLFENEPELLAGFRLFVPKEVELKATQAEEASAVQRQPEGKSTAAAAAPANPHEMAAPAVPLAPLFGSGFGSSSDGSGGGRGGGSSSFSSSGLAPYGFGAAIQQQFDGQYGSSSVFFDGQQGQNGNHNPNGPSSGFFGNNQQNPFQQAASARQQRTHGGRQHQQQQQQQLRQHQQPFTFGGQQPHAHGSNDSALKAALEASLMEFNVQASKKATQALVGQAIMNAGGSANGGGGGGHGRARDEADELERVLRESALEVQRSEGLQGLARNHHQSAGASNLRNEDGDSEDCLLVRTQVFTPSELAGRLSDDSALFLHPGDMKSLGLVRGDLAWLNSSVDADAGALLVAIDDHAIKPAQCAFNEHVRKVCFAPSSASGSSTSSSKVSEFILSKCDDVASAAAVTLVEVDERGEELAPAPLSVVSSVMVGRFALKDYLQPYFATHYRPLQLAAAGAGGYWFATPYRGEDDWIATKRYWKVKEIRTSGNGGASCDKCVVEPETILRVHGVEATVQEKVALAAPPPDSPARPVAAPVAVAAPAAEAAAPAAPAAAPAAVEPASVAPVVAASVEPSVAPAAAASVPSAIAVEFSPSPLPDSSSDPSVVQSIPGGPSIHPALRAFQADLDEAQMSRASLVAELEDLRQQVARANASGSSVALSLAQAEVGALRQQLSFVNLHGGVDKLESQMAKLTVENEALRQSNTALKRENGELKSTLESVLLGGEVARLQLQNVDLQRRLADLEWTVQIEASVKDSVLGGREKKLVCFQCAATKAAQAQAPGRGRNEDLALENQLMAEMEQRIKAGQSVSGTHAPTAPAAAAAPAAAPTASSSAASASSSSSSSTTSSAVSATVFASPTRSELNDSAVDLMSPARMADWPDSDDDDDSAEAWEVTQAKTPSPPATTTAAAGAATAAK